MRRISESECRRKRNVKKRSVLLMPRNFASFVQRWKKSSVPCMTGNLIMNLPGNSGRLRSLMSAISALSIIRIRLNGFWRYVILVRIPRFTNITNIERR